MEILLIVTVVASVIAFAGALSSSRSAARARRARDEYEYRRGR